MIINEDDLRSRLRLGEDSYWEFMRVEFRGNEPANPRREDLADEIAAFANANGGTLLCGITDNGEIRGMSPEQLRSLDNLLVEVCTDTISPALRIITVHQELDGKAFILVQVPKGIAVHERGQIAYIRVGASIRRMDSDERLRLTQNRAQGRYLWFDKQIVPQTGLETLDERLWEPLLSATSASDPQGGC